MKSDVLGPLLKGQPEGKQMWVGSLRGSSMRPILVGGESLKVIRCNATALRPGDIAIMLRADGALIAHLVTATAPVRTASFAGTHDLPGLEVLARVVAVRRGSLLIPLPGLARPILFRLQQAWSWAAQADSVRAIHRLAASAVSSERTAQLRAALGRVEVQTLGVDSFKEVAVALSRWVTLPALAVESLLREDVALGARRRGTLVGLAFVGRDRVLRHAYLQRRAQGLGLELSIIERAIRESEALGFGLVAAEIDPSQPRFRAAAEAFGLEMRSPGHSTAHP